MSHEFFKAGVYYFSDQNFQEAAEYVGTIIVKPKQKEHFIELTESGFSPGDLLFITLVIEKIVPVCFERKKKVK